MSTARKSIPVIFFGALTVFAVSNGGYYVILCLRELFSGSATAWRYFLAAELALLFAWRFLGWTFVSLAILRGAVKDQQVKIKGGGIGRLLFMGATLAAGFGYIIAKFLFRMPWWFMHLGYAVIAVLMFCTFTYPWSRRHRMAVNTALEPPPTRIGTS